MTTEVDLPAFPMTRTCPYHPPQGYAGLREQVPSPKSGCWAIGRRGW